MKIRIASAAVALVVAAGALQTMASVVINGGFETPGTAATDAASWTGTNGTTIARNPTAGVAGSAAVQMNNVSTGAGTALGPFQQTTSLVGGDPITPGKTYSFSFDSQRTFANGGVFQALVNWVTSGGGFISTADNNTITTASATYQTITRTLGTAPPTAGGVQIQFFAITGANAGSTSNVFLDNVTVTPEPASLSLLGLGTLGLLRRRRA